MPTFDDALRALEDRFARAQQEGRIPGVAWGVVRDGQLAHSGGMGTLRDGESVTPDADSVYRIASMTKSFTAAAILLLRDEGRLRLDDPAADHVPQLRAWAGPTADSPPITIRQLLTMSAGLPTDDPWGDRQQSMPLDAFDELLATAPTFAWPPGTQFEYSNMGYAILGRVVTAAGGAEYREVITDRLLAPLGMTCTAFDEEDLAPAHVAHGYMRHGEVLAREGQDPYGAFASMGGLYASVRDLATWVAGFLDAFPARDDPEGSHPLRRAARREMQQMHRPLPAFIEGHPAHQPPLAETAGYGLGLFLVSNADIGLRVSHGGGYPGFGSYMTWHPGSGLGVIALGNLRYAPMYEAASEALTSLVKASGSRRHPRPLPALEAMRPVVQALLAHWDDGVADGIFAMNMDLDQPREARRAEVARIVGELGPLRPDDTRRSVADSATHAAWWLRGDRGVVRVSMLLDPERPPRLQRLVLTPVPDPSAELRALAERLLAAAADPVARWPSDVAAGPALDTAPTVRSLQAAAARLGALRLGLATAGDGSTTATFEVFGDVPSGTDLGDAAPASLQVSIDGTSSVLVAAVLRVTDREAPVEGW